MPRVGVDTDIDVRLIQSTPGRGLVQVVGSSHLESIIVMGAGSTGAAIAHDLALRGYLVTLVERGEIASGTTGRNHALLHSGGRYAVKDPEAAQECMRENQILRRICPGVIEQVGGLFVAIDEEDEAYLATFLVGCAESGIPTEVIGREEALRLEPELNPAVRLAVKVPDGVFDPFRLVASFVATAQANGVRVLPFCRVVGFIQDGRGVSGVRVVSDIRGSAMELKADLVINATGPWGGKVAEMAGARVPVMPSAGVMVALDRRLSRRVVNRLRKPGDGDIIVPQRATSLIGTTSWTVDELEPVPVPRDHIVRMVEEGARLIPAARHTPIKASFSSARPLISGNLESDGREVSRGFQTFDHGARDGIPGLVSVSGGKTTTSRAMAEHVGNLIGRLTGRDIPCRTAEVPLAPYYQYRLLGGLPEARREAVAP